MNNKLILCLFIFLVFITKPLWAHDPIFGIGPHVLFKEGVEIAFDVHAGKSSGARELLPALNLTYGLTGDWAAGIELPYAIKDNGSQSSRGFSDLNIFTKYRFWRKDSLGLQESAAVLLKIKTNNGNDSKTPSLGTGTTDSVLGLTYGYEGRSVYRWASVRYRNNGTDNSGFHRGNKVLVDFVGGIRPKLTSYTEPDTVWLLELNGEFTDKSDLNGSNLANTGGNQWFLSPGVFWTKRNFAIKAGIQFPVANKLYGNQEQDDFRAKVVFELHL